MGNKKGVLGVVNRGIASKREIDQIVVFVDEHSSSTEGKYNLNQSIDEEFRLGMYNPEWGTFHDPVVGEFRNTSTHFVTDEYELFYGPILQECVKFYEEILRELHGIEISDRIPENYLALSIRRGDVDYDVIKARQRSSTNSTSECSSTSTT